VHIPRNDLDIAADGDLDHLKEPEKVRPPFGSSVLSYRILLAIVRHHRCAELQV